MYKYNQIFIENNYWYLQNTMYYNFLCNFVINNGKKELEKIAKLMLKM